MGWRLSCDTAATEQRVHLRDPSLEQECSEPYLASADLREKGALVLLKAHMLHILKPLGLSYPRLYLEF